MHEYMMPDSRLSLREAIALLREEDAKGRDVAPAFAPEVQRSLTAHDAVHVIFGCDTSDRGEAIAHAWMLLGTTATHRQMAEVTKGRDHLAVVAEIGNPRRMKAVLSAIPAIVAAAFRTRRMTKRWEWLGYERYLDAPLADIRHEYGVRLSSPSAG